MSSTRLNTTLIHIFLLFFPLCQVQEVKSALQHVVVLAPWRSGPQRTFYNALQVSSNPAAFFFLKKKYSFSQKHVRTELAITRRKDPSKPDGPHRGVDGARCRSPEESV